MPERKGLLSSGPLQQRRPDSAALFRSEDSLGFACRAQCGGAEGDLTITAHGNLHFCPDAVSGCCATVRQSPQELSVSSDEVVGGILHTDTSFSVWWCEPRGTARPHRKLRRSKRFSASSQDSERCIHLLRRYGSWQGQAEPRRITVLINPVSGQGRSKAIYQREVQPMLDAAGLHVTVIVTQGPGHAARLAAEADLDAVDAFAVVGGDGTIHELLQGYLQHPDWHRAVKIPFMQIPSGTGNALAANCGLWTPATAAYALCKGQQGAIDVASISQPGRPRMYLFLSLTFGIISNLDVGTDHLRWMGSLRFTVGGILESLKAKGYCMDIAFLSADSAPSGSQAPAAMTEDKQRMCPPFTPNLDALGDLSQVDICNAASLPKGWQSLGTQSVGLFIICNLPFIDKEVNLAPKQQLHTGKLHMVWAQRSTRCRNLRYLLSFDRDGNHMKIPTIQLEQISAFILQPVSPGTMLVVDGEQMPYERICGEIHRGLCQVIIAK